MVKLPSKAERDNLNIDTWERAIMYSGLLLYRGVRDENSDLGFNGAVTITAPSSDSNRFNVTINANFKFDRSFSLELGGNFIEAVEKFNFSEPDVTPYCPPSNTFNFVLLDEDDPSFITGSTERYFAWLCHRVKSSLITTGGDAGRIRSQFFLDNSEYPQLRISVSLPVNNLCYLDDDNIVCCLLPLLTDSPSVKAIDNFAFTKTTEIVFNDRKAKVYGKPLFPHSFTYKSEYEHSEVIIRIYPTLEHIVSKVSEFEHTQERVQVETHEVTKTVSFDYSEYFTGKCNMNNNNSMNNNTELDNCLPPPIDDNYEFTRLSEFVNSGSVQNSEFLHTYNKITPFTVPASSVSEDHDNFVVYVRFEDLNLGMTVSEWASKTSGQKEAFLQSIRLKEKNGLELPTFIRGSYYINNSPNPPELLSRGYIYFLAPYLSASQDNEFFINFDSDSVATNPDEKQVFQDYGWVSLTVYTDFAQPLYNNDELWNQNQVPSGISNNVPLDINAARLKVEDSNATLPLDNAVNAEAVQGADSSIDTASFGVNDEATLTIWTSQGIDSLLKFSNLGFDTRTQTGRIESIDTVNNTFYIPAWESKFNDGDIVFFGYKTTGNEDGTLVEQGTTTPIDGNYTLDADPDPNNADTFFVINTSLGLLNGVSYNGLLQVRTPSDTTHTITEVDTVNNSITVLNGDAYLTSGNTYTIEFDQLQEIDGDVINNSLTTPEEAGMYGLDGYGSTINNRNVNILEAYKYIINKVDQNHFELISIVNNSNFSIDTINGAVYNGRAKIAGNTDLQSNLPEEKLSNLLSTNFDYSSFRRLDRTVNDAYINGNGQGSNSLSSIPNDSLQARLYSGTLASYIRLAKYTKSQLRIVDEYTNETDPSNFYQVGTVQTQ